MLGLFKKAETPPPRPVGSAVVRSRKPVVTVVPTARPMVVEHAANEHAAPEGEKPSFVPAPTFEEDLFKNPDQFSIAWDVMGLAEGSERAEWVKSNAVVLQRAGNLEVIAAYAEAAKGTLLLNELLKSVQNKRRINSHHVISADLLHKIYQDFDRRGKLNLNGTATFGQAHTIHDTQLSELLKLSMQVDASDIHFRIRKAGGEEQGQILMRIDAELEEVRQFKPNLALELVAALYAKADTRSVVAGQGQFNEERPFSGFIRMAKERNIELRFQSHPERYGVDVVCRVLGYEGKKLVASSLKGLGFLPSAIEIIEESAYGPGGGVITVGETGSGKTTTINAILTGHPAVQAGHDYAITVEDPPEGRPPHVSQFPVARSVESKKVGEESPFIPVLRATMRMDGDVISPGEIRDGDSAQIWLELALTGHKCFASIHAPSPRGAMERLCGKMMGLTPETISGEHVLGAAVFQKRVPKLCPDCRISAREAWTTPREVKKLNALEEKGMDPASLFVRNMNGCNKCRAGKKGALVLPEIFNPNLEHRMLMAKGQFAEAELEWRKTRGTTPFTNENVQGKTCFEVGLYHASIGELGIDTLDKSVQRILSHTLIGTVK